MRSALPKVLHRVAGRPMIAHVLAAAEALSPASITVVLAPGMDAVAAAVAPHGTAVQARPLGTADAVAAAREATAEVAAAGGEVLVLYGDGPLVTPGTLEAMRRARRESGSAFVWLGFRPDDPTGYGRLIRDGDGRLLRIVEEKDADPAERAERLVWSGLLLADAAGLFALLPRIGNDNAKGEYYLTALARLAAGEGLTATVTETSSEEGLGVNSRAELAVAEAAMQRRLRRRAMEEGATLVAPETVFLSWDTRLGRDVTVHPHVVFGPGVTVDEGVEILSFSHLEGARVGPGARIGPYARLRPGSELAAGVHVGNFVETKAARLAEGAKANHLTYLGDCEVGPGTNIGAGTITCNYDGFAKHRTAIGARVFIGSDPALVAPVTVGDGAMVAAGSVVTEDVPADALALARGRQVNKPQGAAAFRARKKAPGKDGG